jgi:signal transduction histidine kinase
MTTLGSAVTRHRIGKMASEAHEILHPIASARNNARAAMRFLDMSPPNTAEVREALACIVRDADRGKDIVDRIRAHIKKHLRGSLTSMKQSRG